MSIYVVSKKTAVEGEEPRLVRAKNQSRALLMASTLNIVDSAGATLQDLVPRDAAPDQFALAQRLYMRAALDTLDLLRADCGGCAAFRAVQADLIGYGKTIGRQVEVAR